MTSTRVYITCATKKLWDLRDDAQFIALQKGCDPERVLWPEPGPEESGETIETYETELWVCRKQFRRLIGECDILVAIVEGDYGEAIVPHPEGAVSGEVPQYISALHFEILETMNAPGRRPEIVIFALATERDIAVQKMLSEVKGRIYTYESDMQFRADFSTKLAEYRHSLLTGILASLPRIKLTVQCENKKGVLAKFAEAINQLKGNIAWGVQSTKGGLAVLHFVAEWRRDHLPEGEVLERTLRLVLPGEDVWIQSERMAPGEAEFKSLVTFIVTFVDQPGVANHIFTKIKTEDLSVTSTELETFLAGGLMLGRIQFRLQGDNLAPSRRALLADRLRKLPGVLHVDETSFHGRYWS